MPRVDLHAGLFNHRQHLFTKGVCYCGEKQHYGRGRTISVYEIIMFKGDDRYTGECDKIMGEN